MDLADVKSSIHQGALIYFRNDSKEEWIVMGSNERSIGQTFDWYNSISAIAQPWMTLPEDEATGVPGRQGLGLQELGEEISIIPRGRSNRACETRKGDPRGNI